MLGQFFFAKLLNTECHKNHISNSLAMFVDRLTDSLGTAKRKSLQTFEANVLN